MQSVVFDAVAILAWFKREPGYQFVRALVQEVARGGVRGAVCAINLGEVYCIVSRERRQAVADELLRELLHLPWHIIPASDDLVWAAARLKAQYPISYADAFALACAQAHQADLITADPELTNADHGVTVRWET